MTNDLASDNLIELVFYLKFQLKSRRDSSDVISVVSGSMSTNLNDIAARI